jgi:hypothetical protein
MDYYHTFLHRSRTGTGSGMSNEEATKPLQDYYITKNALQTIHRRYCSVQKM